MDELDSNSIREGFSTPEPIYPARDPHRPHLGGEVLPRQTEEAEGDLRLLVIIRERDELEAEIIDFGGTEKTQPEIVQHWRDVSEEVLNSKARKRAEKKAEEAESSGRSADDQ